MSYTQLELQGVGYSEERMNRRIERLKRFFKARNMKLMQEGKNHRPAEPMSGKAVNRIAGPVRRKAIRE